MSGVAVIAYLLTNDAGIIAAGAQAYAGDAPEKTPLPFCSACKVSGVERETVSMAEATRLRRERVQVTVAAGGYAAKKQLTELVRAACRNRTGTVNGYSVLSILPAGEGPEVDDVASQVYSESVDFFVRWRSA